MSCQLLPWTFIIDRPSNPHEAFVVVDALLRVVGVPLCSVFNVAEERFDESFDLVVTPML